MAPNDACGKAAAMAPNATPTQMVEIACGSDAPKHGQFSVHTRGIGGAPGALRWSAGVALDLNPWEYPCM